MVIMNIVDMDVDKTAKNYAKIQFFPQLLKTLVIFCVLGGTSVLSHFFLLGGTSSILRTSLGGTI